MKKKSMEKWNIDPSVSARGKKVFRLKDQFVHNG